MQSGKCVVEWFGRLKSVPQPGANFLVPFFGRVAHRIPILEPPIPNAEQDAITRDNALGRVETSVFSCVLQTKKTVQRARDVDAAIVTTVAGIVRAEIGMMELDGVRSNRFEGIGKITAQVA